MEKRPIIVFLKPVHTISLFVPESYCTKVHPVEVRYLNGMINHFFCLYFRRKKKY